MDELRQAVIEIVAQIPAGTVLTYGQLARLAGYPRHSRMVGSILCHMPETLDLPCHRVVNASGRTAPGWDEQAQLLRDEGVAFKANGCVDLKAHLWSIVENM